MKLQMRKVAEQYGNKEAEEYIKWAEADAEKVEKTIDKLQYELKFTTLELQSLVPSLVRL